MSMVKAISGVPLASYFIIGNGNQFNDRCGFPIKRIVGIPSIFRGRFVQTTFVYFSENKVLLRYLKMEFEKLPRVVYWNRNTV